MKLDAGSTIGPYQIVALIGAGGMGEVYKARDPQLARDAAIKVLPEHVSARNEALARLENEARLASSLNHPNIVTIYSIGWEGPHRYIAMEYLDGPTLQDLVDVGPIPVDRAIGIASQVADGLAKAHEAGIVHRDLKPKNVMLTGDGVAKILDFGLSKMAEPILHPDERTPTYVDGDNGLTRPGTILGTIDYMSPEQAAGRSVDFHSDQFALGSVIYTLLTSRRPFHRETAVQTLNSIIESDPQPASKLNPHVPQELDLLIRRCMMKDPLNRYDSTRDLARDLRSMELKRQPHSRYWTRRDVIRASLTVGLPLAAGGGLWIWIRRPYQPDPAALEWYQKGLSAFHSMAFDSARKAFERAGASDAKFALAQASAGIAYDLLGYSDRATKSMLQAVAAARETRLSRDEEMRLRALQLIVSREYDRAVPLFRQLENAADGRERAAAALEFGWLAEKREDTEGAGAAYERALKINPAYAAARLRLGYIQQRRGEDASALKSYAQAEELYDAATDFEGVTECLYQRASLLNRRSRSAEALPLIEKAIQVARVGGYRYQEIRLQLLKSAALTKLGRNTSARELAEQAIDDAVTEKMSNLATSGMIALGNVLSFGGDYENAERYFRRALTIAREENVERYEALASLSLGALFEQKNRPEEARQFAGAAEPFYRRAGYRREFVQVMTILGSSLHQLGDFDRGAEAFRKALPSAIQLRDLGLELVIRERLAETLQDQGAWPEALQESERAAGLPITGIQIAYAHLNSAGLYWRLGRRQDAERSLAVVEQLLSKSEDPQFLSMLRLREAEIAYADGRFEKACDRARMSVSAMPTTGDLTEPDAKLIEALVFIGTGRRKDGLQLVRGIIEEFEHFKLIGKAAAARLAAAGALSAVRERGFARPLALEALDFFKPRSIWESVWRGQLILMHLSEESGEAREHEISAREALAQLRKLWPAASVERYLVRPDIKSLTVGLHF
jgi:tetratricopeptide (TPR) repeat protein